MSLKVPEKASAAVSRWFSDNKLFDGIDDKEDLTLPEMPKTDKEIRHAKRKAAMERKERRAAKKLKKEEKEYELEFGTEFDIAAPADSDEEAAMAAEADEESDDEANAEKKSLIRSGMGAALKGDHGSSDKFEVVAAGEEPDENALPVMDDRKYDSDHEEYDAEDRAKTLALASMMVQKSKAKDLIDASYNRYAWNDSEALPDWFADDEEKHYRPQIPIPKNVLAQMKELSHGDGHEACEEGGRGSWPQAATADEEVEGCEEEGYRHCQPARHVDARETQGNRPCHEGCQAPEGEQGLRRVDARRNQDRWWQEGWQGQGEAGRPAYEERQA